jgi:CDP-glucose 4,6-dehydratase
MNLEKNFKNKKILITGHTGFKGSWLTTWFLILGAKVIGISNGTPTSPSHYKLLNLKNKIIDKKLDIKNLKKLKIIVNKYQPDYVFHLAAQAIVKKSYEDPINTWNSNTLGTINILEPLRVLKKKCVVVLITSDKSYKNLEIKRGYTENDKLGGEDPYSASKACADIAIQSYINSFFKKKRTSVFIAIGRAGNVVGGGDWSPFRLIPDCIRSWSVNKKATIRNPNSTRPWQHVLEALFGYIVLAVKLNKNKNLHGEVFNFGPSNRYNYKVIDVVRLMKKIWKNVNWKIVKNNNFKESALLKLNSKKAKKKLNWKSILTFRENISLVAKWYKYFNFKPKTTFQITSEQILEYQKKINKRIC